MSAPSPVLRGAARRGLHVEMGVVLGLSLGSSAIYSILTIVNRLTARVPLAQQHSSLNAAVTPDRPWLDLAYQLVQIGLGLVPVALALYLLRQVWPPVRFARASGDPAAYRSVTAFLGADLRRPRFDLGGGVLLAAAIGIPGLGLYVAARALGINTQVAAAGLEGAWWTVPVLVLAAFENGLLEEAVMNGYLLTRMRQTGWSWWAAIGASSLIRGTYHLYQGFGAFAGNAVMGLVFGWVFRRWRRIGPLVVAHTLLDVVSFVGYTVARDHLAWLR